MKVLAESDNLSFEIPQAGEPSVKEHDRWPLSLCLIIEVGSIALNDWHVPGITLHREVGAKIS
jgi:hypothetical protein